MISAVAKLSAMADRLAGAPCPIVLSTVSRNDLPAFCQARGFTKGAEIGVWRGAYSAKFCKAGMHMLCVDPWVSYPAWKDTKNQLPIEEAEVFMAEAYEEACDRLRPLSATVDRRFAHEASADVEAGSLDFVYVDGNHVEAEVRADLAWWAPKIRPGGFVAGHDYRVFPNKPFVQVIPAVQAYTAEHAIDPWFVLAADRTPSFLWMVR